MDGTELDEEALFSAISRSSVPSPFEEALDADADLLDTLGPYVPCFRFLRDDLSMQPDADLRGPIQMTAGGRVTILSLKHVRGQVEVRTRVLSQDEKDARGAASHYERLQPPSSGRRKADAAPPRREDAGQPPLKALNPLTGGCYLRPHGTGTV